jgi:dTDP-4-amino-4,6-dideoxy-D-galactose acyltransferase
MNEASELCQYLDWDSEFFGKRIARLKPSRLSVESLNSVLAWCDKQAIDCLYFLADSDDPQTVWLSEEYGFHLVEIRMTLEKTLKDWDPSSRPKASENAFIRPVKHDDIPVLQEIARGSYVDSRFYFDRNFSQSQWSAYYATWVKKSCEGGADLALIAEMEGRVKGYITGLIDKQKNVGIYELTGVDPSARRSGIGQELFRSGLDWYVRHGIDYIWVATQGRNVTTQRMIQRHGFLSKSCQFYYHKWFKR